jgi:type II secretory pathway pseudopilin PulG
MKNNSRGASLITVLVSISVASIAAASVVSLMMTQRKLALRKELEMHAVNAAESAIDYAYSMLINKIGTSGDFDIDEIPTTGYSTLTLPSSGLNFLSRNINMPSGTYDGETGSVVLKNATIRVLPVAASADRRFVDPADPANDDDPNRGQWVWDTEVPLVAQVTSEQGGQTYTAYLKKSVVGRRVPMFQHAIFFQGQLQLHRSYRIVGPVHTNGTLLLNAQNGDTSVYAGGMTSAGHFYRGSSNDAGGSGIDAFGYTPVDINGDIDFSVAVSPVVNLRATGTNRISLYIESQEVSGSAVHITGYTNPGFDSRIGTWQNDALRNFKGNLQDKSHQVPTFTPQGSVGYRQDVAATTGVNEFSNGTYSLIEPLLPAGHANRKTATGRANKLAARASLILRVERNNAFTPESSPGSPYNSQLADPGGGAQAYNVGGVNRYFFRVSGGTNIFFTTANEWQASNRNERFVVKGYKYSVRPSSGVEPVLAPVRLPDRMIGTANVAMTSVNSGEPFAENTEYTGSGT